MPAYDDKQIHYGFQLALNHTGFKLKHSDQSVSDTTYNKVYPSYTTGFSLGFIFNYRLNDFMDARLLPTVAFYDRTVTYEYNDVSEPAIPHVFESTFVEFPILLKYKSVRRRNTRFYMLGGIKPAIEVGAKKKDKKDDQLRTRPFDLTLEYGLGIDMYQPLFKFSPEVRFSLGLANLLVDDPNPFSEYLDRVSTFTVTVAALFE